MVVSAEPYPAFVRSAVGLRAESGTPAMHLAEAVRFELTRGLPLCRFSRPVPSTARPRLQRMDFADFLDVPRAKIGVGGQQCLRPSPTHT